jgi:hypothetical protein
LGQEWWYEKRKEACAMYDYTCWACGVHENDVKWLEGHECYDIDYAVGSAELKEIVALCHACHNFIHSGRMWMMVTNGTMDKEKMVDIMQHGFKVLNDNNLKPHPHSAEVWRRMTAEVISCSQEHEITSAAEWGDWHLIIDGKKYYSKFENLNEWHQFYRKGTKMSEDNAPLDKKEVTDVAENRNLVPVSKDTHQYDLQSSAQWVPDVKPGEVISRAQEQSSALMDIVETQKLYHVIKGKKYLMVEAWQLLAAFNGLNIVVESTQRIKKDDAEGWEAKCSIYNSEGRKVGAGEAECLNSEKNWANRDDYMLRSMAQTRAVSKACRTILSFVVVLAGYEPTPYDEMSGVGNDNASDEQINVINNLATKKTIEWIRGTFGKEVTELTQQQASALITRLRKAKGGE